MYLVIYKKYKEQGTRPIYLEGSFKEKMKNIVEKTLYYDIPYFLKEVNENLHRCYEGDTKPYSLFKNSYYKYRGYV